MFDIEANEQRELAALMARDELPTPNEATRAALAAAGVVLGPSAPGAPLVVATLPPRWRKERAEVARAFWILDADGRRRFRVWWKAALPFAMESGYGGVAEVERRDDYARRWSADDSFEVMAHDERHFEISCRRCDLRLRWTLAGSAEREHPQARAEVEERAGRAFAAKHPKCPAAREIERVGVSFSEWLAAHPSPTLPPT